MQKRVNNKAAVELSISTIVIIVLAMSMLILGLVLVKSIFTGANYNVDQMNNKVKDEINKLFVEDKRTVVYLPNSLAQIKQGDSWGIAFAIKNLNTGTATAGSFTYSVAVSDPNVRQKCGLGEAEINSWITTGQADTISIAPGQTSYNLVRLQIPEASPLCIVRFHLDVKQNGQVYSTESFDVQVMPK